MKTTVIGHPHGFPISYISPAKVEANDIDLTATIVNAALKRKSHVDYYDVMVRVRRARGKRLCAIILDSSGSMTAMKRITIAKGIAINFAEEAYVKRDDLALICFKGNQAEVLLHPTRRYSKAIKLLEEVKTGGRTPLPSALQTLCTMAKIYRTKHSEAAVTGVLVTDGKGNVPIGKNVKDDVERLCKILKKMDVKLKIYDARPSGIIDPSPSFINLIAELAEAEVYRA